MLCGRGTSLSFLRFPMSSILHQTLRQPLNSFTDQMAENKNRKFVMVKHSEGSYNTKPVNKIAFQIRHVDPGREKNNFLSQPSFSFITKPVTTVLHKLQLVTTSISLFYTPLHSLGWVSVTQTINISTLPFTVMP